MLGRVSLSAWRVLYLDREHDFKRFNFNPEEVYTC
jgi:hypothetical protein